MEFKEALAKVYRSKRTMNKLYDPLVLFGCVSDLIGNSFVEKKKASLFFNMDKEVSFFKTIIENDNDTSIIVSQYEKVSDKVDYKKYMSLVNIVLEIIQCEGRCYYPGNKVKAKPQQVKKPPEHKKATPKPVVQQTHEKASAPTNPVAQQAPAQASAPTNNTTTVTQTTQTSSSPSTSSVDSFTIMPWIIGIAVVIVAVVLLAVFGKRIQWYQWQHIIGSIGGLILLGGIFALCYNADDEGESYPIDVAVIAMLNFTLAFILKDKYSTICYWMFSYIFVALVAFFFYGMYECVDTYIAVTIITFICNIILLIFFALYVNGIFAPTNLSYVGEQCVISFCLIVVIAICTLFICYQMDDLFTLESSTTTTIILIVVMILNYILAFTLKNDYRIICYWLAPASIVGMAISSSYLDDMDMPTAVGFGATIVNIVLLIIYCFIDKFVFV
ncbi:MAG: hypothetical protein J5656_01510 [Clostridia bacterium]|nr:hypothetical protein [Clostridia bacterium]